MEIPISRSRDIVFSRVPDTCYPGRRSPSDSAHRRFGCCSAAGSHCRRCAGAHGRRAAGAGPVAGVRCWPAARGPAGWPPRCVKQRCTTAAAPATPPAAGRACGRRAGRPGTCTVRPWSLAAPSACTLLLSLARGKNEPLGPHGSVRVMYQEEGSNCRTGFWMAGKGGEKHLPRWQGKSSL